MLILGQFEKKKFRQGRFWPHCVFSKTPIACTNHGFSLLHHLPCYSVQKYVLTCYKNVLHHKLTTFFLFIFSRFPEVYPHQEAKIPPPSNNKFLKYGKTKYNNYISDSIIACKYQLLNIGWSYPSRIYFLE